VEQLVEARNDFVMKNKTYFLKELGIEELQPVA
jgi:hypothetical protein